MHQNLATFLHQSNYGKNSFLVLIQVGREEVDKRAQPERDGDQGCGNIKEGPGGWKQFDSCLINKLVQINVTGCWNKK